MLFIDPVECIDCDACTPACPVEAIYHEDAVPDEWTDFIALNREMAAICPPIVERKEPLAHASFHRTGTLDAGEPARGLGSWNTVDLYPRTEAADAPSYFTRRRCVDRPFPCCGRRRTRQN